MAKVETHTCDVCGKEISRAEWHNAEPRLHTGAEQFKLQLEWSNGQPASMQVSAPTLRLMHASRPIDAVTSSRNLGSLNMVSTEWCSLECTRTALSRAFPQLFAGLVPATSAQHEGA